MNRIRNGLLILLFVIALPACSLPPELPNDPPSGLTEAWFHDDCAPWDGAALSLYLGAEPAGTVLTAPFPHLRVSLYSGLLQLPTGERLRFEVPGNRAHAVYCESEEDCLPATRITIEFSELERDRMAGSLEILFETDPPVRGSFRASRIPFQALCG